MSTKSIGNEAEGRVAEFLNGKGYRVVNQNWRNRWCEIDIVASKNKVIYFIEVKYRKNDFYGDGLDAITNVKLKQMQFAAEHWILVNKWDGDYRMMAASVSNNSIEMIEI